MPRKKQMLSQGTMEMLMRKVLDENALDVKLMRVSDEGAQELGIILYDRAEEIILKASRMALHAKRKTIKRSDIELAK